MQNSIIAADQQQVRRQALLADARCLLNPLVVWRFAPNSQRVISAAIVPRAKRPAQQPSLR